MVFTTVFLLLGNIFGVIPTIDCTKLESESSCRNTGWCVWSVANTCILDLCLKYVPDETTDYSNACDKTSGWGCTLFYLSDKHDCSTGEPLQSDLYCRTNIESNLRKPMDSCFYNDLKALSLGDTNAGNCSTSLCASQETSGVTFCAPTGNPACDEFYQDNKNDQFCNCLGLGSKSYCDLFPGCISTSKSCNLDPCYSLTSKDFTGCANVPGGNPNDCQPKNVSLPNANKDGSIIGQICLTRSHTDYNPCYYLQDASTTSNYPQYPECTELKENEPLCTNSVVIKPDGTQDGSKKCAFTPIGGHYFNAGDAHYCDDGARKNGVPSPNGASAAHIPLLAALILVAIVLFV